MRITIFNIVTNMIAAVVLFGVGAHEMNNLMTSIPATLCLIAAILAIVQVKKQK